MIASTIPTRIIESRRNRLEAAATIRLPTKYAAMFTVASEPATVFDRPKSSRTAGSSTP